LRPDGASATGGTAANAQESNGPNGPGNTVAIDNSVVDAPPRATGNAALARRAAGPN
jgi:cyclic-di-GMP phosphodiesterase TipF (flagellum assembly factor)